MSSLRPPETTCGCVYSYQMRVFWWFFFPKQNKMFLLSCFDVFCICFSTREDRLSCNHPPPDPSAFVPTQKWMDWKLSGIHEIQQWESQTFKGVADIPYRGLGVRISGRIPQVEPLWGSLLWHCHTIFRLRSAVCRERRKLWALLLLQNILCSQILSEKKYNCQE